MYEYFSLFVIVVASAASKLFFKKYIQKKLKRKERLLWDSFQLRRQWLRFVARGSAGGR